MRASFTRGLPHQGEEGEHEVRPYNSGRQECLPHQEGGETPPPTEATHRRAGRALPVRAVLAKLLVYVGLLVA